MAHFVTQRSPDCLLWSVEYAIISFYYRVAIVQYMHTSYMVQSYIMFHEVE